MASLFSLPPEMIEHCFSFADHQTLAVLCRTCTFSKVIAWPLLCSNIGVLGTKRRSYRLQRLCQRMIEEPHLAGRVRGITQSVTSSYSTLRNKLIFEMEHWIALSAKTRRLSRSIVGVLSWEFFSEGDWLIVLLLLCRNVRTLELTGQWTSEMLLRKNEFATIMHYFEVTDVEPLEHLRAQGELAHSHDAGFYSISELFISDEAITVNNVVPYLNLPGLSKLYLQSLVGFHISRGRVLSFKNCALKTITIANCSATVIDIYNLLCSFQGLESLTIIWSTSQEAHRMPRCRMIGTGLKQHAESLHTLHLDYHVDMLPAAKHGPFEGSVLKSIGSLAHMERLETLTIPKNALCMAPGETLYLLGSSVDPPCTSPREIGSSISSEHGFSDSEMFSDEETSEESFSEDTSSAWADSDRDDSDMEVADYVDDDGRRPSRLPESVRHLTVLCEECELNQEEIIAEMRQTWSKQPEDINVLNCTKTSQFRVEASP